MKIKKILFISLSIFSLFFLFSCNFKINEIMQEKISEARFNLFTSSNENINVKFTSGFREDPYILNGKSENKKEFGVITVKFLFEISDKIGLPSFVINISDMDFDGDFELNPFDQTYVQDIETFVLDSSEVSIKIYWQDFYYESKLENISLKFKINHKQALNIFIKEFEKKIKTLLKSKIDFEVYVKIINDPSLELDKNYFYVSLISTSGESFSIVIDPYFNKILAKNENNGIIL